MGFWIYIIPLLIIVFSIAFYIDYKNKKNNINPEDQPNHNNYEAYNNRGDGFTGGHNGCGGNDSGGCV